MNLDQGLKKRKEKKMANKPTMALSTNQAKVVASFMGVDCPKKNNGWRRHGPYRLTRLPVNFRKRKPHSLAFRLTAEDKDELTKLFRIVNEVGRRVFVSYMAE